MTPAATPIPADHVSSATVLRRAAAAEWTRLWTLRSTWYALLVGAGVMLSMGVALGLDIAREPDPPPFWLAAEFAIVPGQFPFLLIVALAVTAEYSTGAIRGTLQWVPRRGILLLARTVVPVAVVTVATVGVALATDVVAWASMGGDGQVLVADIARSLGMIAVIMAAGGALTAGLGLALRSMAGTLTSIFLLLLVLPIILFELDVTWLTWLGRQLPGLASFSLLEAMDIPMDPGRAGVVLAAWAAAATSAAAWSVLRRDAV